jgi:hypothetical protein
MNQLARQVDMDQGLLSKIERGLRPPPEIVPHVQRIAEAFGFKKGSTEYEELVNAAYQERFGKRKQGSPLKGAIVSFVLDTGRTAPGLSGWSPEPARPESTDYQPSAFDLDEFEAHMDKILQSRMFESAPDLRDIARLLLSCHGIKTSHGLEHRGPGISCDFRLFNGEEYHLSITPKNPSTASATDDGTKQGEGQ